MADEKYVPLPAKPGAPTAPTTQGLSWADKARLLAATGLRVAGPMAGGLAGGLGAAALGLGTEGAGLAAGPAMVAGGSALGGGLSEALAEKIEPHNTKGVNLGRVAVAAGMGAVPGSMVLRAGKPLASAALGAGLGYAGTAGNKLAEGKDLNQSLNPLEWDKAEVALGPVAGGMAGGILGRFLPSSRKAIAQAKLDEAAKTIGGASKESGLLGAVDELDKHQPLGTGAVKLDQYKGQGVKTAPVTAEGLATREAINAKTLQEPSGDLAKRIYGPKGRPSVEKGKDVAPSITEMETIHGEANKSAAAQKGLRVNKLQKEFTQAVNAKNTRLDKISKEVEKDLTQQTRNEKATSKYVKDTSTQEARNLNAKEKYVKTQNEQEARNLNSRDKYVSTQQAQDAKNLNAKAKYLQGQDAQEAKNLNARDKYVSGVEKAENKVTADELKTREAGFSQEAKNENAREKFLKSLTKSREDADAENVKRNAAAVTQANAEKQVQTLDDLKGTLTEVHEPTSISESITGPGEHGGTERAIFRRQAPEPEEGEGGALGGGSNTGGSSPQAPDPTFLHYTRASAAKEAKRLGGPEKWDIVEPRKGVFKITPHVDGGVKAAPEDLAAMGLGGEPPADAAPTGAPPTPDAPVPPSPSDEGLAHLSPVEKESLFNKSMSQKEAEVLAKHLGLEVTQAGPGNRNFRVKRPAGVEPYVEPASPEIPSEPDVIAPKPRELPESKGKTKPNEPTTKERKEMEAMQARDDEARRAAGLPTRKLPNGSVSAEVTDYTGGDAPTLDVEPPTGGSSPNVAPEAASGGAAPSGPEFEAYKAKYNDLYSKMMGASSEEAQSHLNALMDHFDENPAWGEYLSQNIPSVEPQALPKPAVGLKSAKFEEAGNNDLEKLLEDAHGSEINPEDLNLNAAGKGQAPSEPPMSINDFASALSQEGNKPIVPVNMPNSPVKTGLHGPEAESGNLFGDEAPKGPPDLFSQPEAPIEATAPQVPQVPEGGAIPARLFKSKVEHINDPEMGYPATQAALKAGELPTSPHAPVDYRGRQTNTARQQGAVKAELNNPKPQAPAEVPQAPQAPVDDVADIQAQIESASTDPTTREVLKRYLKNFMSEGGAGGGQGGSINPKLMMHLGFGAGGAALGAAASPDDPFSGAVMGGAAGAALPSLGSKLPAFDFKALVKRIPDIQRFNYLSDPNGLVANTIAAPLGLGTTTAFEKMLQGDPAGFKLLKGLGSLPRRWDKSMAEAGEMLSSSPENISEALPYQRATNWFDKGISLPATSITASHLSLRDVARDAGIPLNEATSIALGNEPGNALGPENFLSRWIRTGGQGLQNMKSTRSVDPGVPDEPNIIGNLVAPFTRTATNVGAATPMRTPGLGLLLKAAGAPEKLSQVAAQQGVGTAVATGAYALGNNVDPGSARYVRKWVRNAGGKYGLIATTAFMAGQAAQEGKAIKPAILKGVEEGFPMPTSEVMKDWLDFASNAAQGNMTLPKSAVPGFLKGTIEENTDLLKNPEKKDSMNFSYTPLPPKK